MKANMTPDQILNWKSDYLVRMYATRYYTQADAQRAVRLAYRDDVIAWPGAGKREPIHVERRAASNWRVVVSV